MQPLRLPAEGARAEGHLHLPGGEEERDEKDGKKGKKKKKLITPAPVVVFFPPRGLVYFFVPFLRQI